MYVKKLINVFVLGFDDMQNRFIPEWIPSFAAHNKQWTKIQAGQHHTMLLDEEGKYITDKEEISIGNLSRYQLLDVIASCSRTYLISCVHLSEKMHSLFFNYLEFFYSLVSKK